MVKPLRSALLPLAATLLSSSLATGLAQAQTAAWPTKAVRLTLPAAPGTAPDIMARVLGDRFAKLWGQAVIIENKPGAGGVIGMAAVKNGEKDHHGLAFAPASVLTMTNYMYRSNQVDINRDFTGVALIGMSPMMIAVAANNPANTLADLLAVARRAPDKFVISTTFQYSVPHLAADMLARAVGIPLRSVPFANSTQSIQAVVNGDAQAMIDGVPPIDPLLKGGRLKALGIFAETRVPGRAQTPAVVETVPGMVINGWFGIVAPVGTLVAAIERVNRDAATVTAMPEVVERFDGLGVYPKALSVGQFNTFWQQETGRWEKALKDVGAQPVQ